MTKAKTSTLLLLGIFMAFSSCKEEEPRLTRAHRKVVDSLVQKEKVRIRPIIDSLCDIRYEKELKVKADSIVEERMAEIKRKIEADANQN